METNKVSEGIINRVAVLCCEVICENEKGSKADVIWEGKIQKRWRNYIRNSSKKYEWNWKNKKDSAKGKKMLVQIGQKMKRENKRLKKKRNVGSSWEETVGMEGMVTINTMY